MRRCPARLRRLSAPVFGLPAVRGALPPRPPQGGAPPLPPPHGVQGAPPGGGCRGVTPPDDGGLSPQTVATGRRCLGRVDLRATLTLALTLAILSAGLVPVAAVARDQPLAPFDLAGRVRPGPYLSGRTQPMPLVIDGGAIAVIAANGLANTTDLGSPIAEAGVRLVLSPVTFDRQIADVIAGRSNFVQGTLGQLVAASDRLAAAGVGLAVVYPLARSTGADALVVSGAVGGLGALREVALTAHGRHLKLLLDLLSFAGKDTRAVRRAGRTTTIDGVRLAWSPDTARRFIELSGPAAALRAGEVSAALVPLSEAAGLVAGRGNANQPIDRRVGDGREPGSVAGARVLVTTRELSQSVVTLLAVRADYGAAHRAEIRGLAHALLRAQETIDQEMRGDWQRTLPEALPDILLQDPTRADAVQTLWQGTTPLRWTGTKRYLTDPDDPHGFAKSHARLVAVLAALGALDGDGGAVTPYPFDDADWQAMRAGLKERFGAAPQAPMASGVMQARVRSMFEAGALGREPLLRFSIHFPSNSEVTDFGAPAYRPYIDRALDLLVAAPDSVFSLVGHVDPTKYLLERYSRRYRQPETVWKRTLSSGRSMSLRRVEGVLEAMRDRARARGLDIAFDQIVTIGKGMAEPSEGNRWYAYRRPGAQARVMVWDAALPSEPGRRQNKRVDVVIEPVGKVELSDDEADQISEEMFEDAFFD